MKATIFYYSGTGNSLWIAKTIAGGLGEAKVESMLDWEKEKNPVDSDIIGFVFPVHMWGIPARIIEFVNAFPSKPSAYVFAAAVNAGQVSNTLVQLKKLLKKNNTELSSGFDMVMPSNYIPWGGPGPEEKLRKLFEAAKIKISGITRIILAQEKRPVEKGPLWQRIILTLLYKASFNYVPKMDSKFRVDEKCNQCGICEKVCPSGNIVLAEGKPTWHKKCEQCLACIQWCPRESIQYGPKTHAYPRYHHPEIVLKEMMKG